MLPCPSQAQHHALNYLSLICQRKKKENCSSLAHIVSPLCLTYDLSHGLLTLFLSPNLPPEVYFRSFSFCLLLFHFLISFTAITVDATQVIVNHHLASAPTFYFQNFHCTLVHSGRTLKDINSLLNGVLSDHASGRLLTVVKTTVFALFKLTSTRTHLPVSVTLTRVVVW